MTAFNTFQQADAAKYAANQNRLATLGAAAFAADAPNLQAQSMRAAENRKAGLAEYLFGLPTGALGATAGPAEWAQHRGPGMGLSGSQSDDIMHGIRSGAGFGAVSNLLRGYDPNAVSSTSVSASGTPGTSGVGDILQGVGLTGNVGVSAPAPVPTGPGTAPPANQGISQPSQIRPNQILGQSLGAGGQTMLSNLFQPTEAALGRAPSMIELRQSRTPEQLAANIDSVMGQRTPGQQPAITEQRGESPVLFQSRLNQILGNAASSLGGDLVGLQNQAAGVGVDPRSPAAQAIQSQAASRALASTQDSLTDATLEKDASDQRNLLASQIARENQFASRQREGIADDQNRISLFGQLVDQDLGSRAQDLESQIAASNQYSQRVGERQADQTQGLNLLGALLDQANTNQARTLQAELGRGELARANRSLDLQNAQANAARDLQAQTTDQQLRQSLLGQLLGVRSGDLDRNLRAQLGNRELDLSQQRQGLSFLSPLLAGLVS